MHFIQTYLYSFRDDMALEVIFRLQSDQIATLITTVQSNQDSAKPPFLLS